jgi:hypothetical protein
MANLIIKSSADNLVLQGSDASPAITVGATGTTTFAENATLSGTANNLGTATVGTLGSGLTFPPGHVIQTEYFSTGTYKAHINSTAYTTTNVTDSITVRSATSKILVLSQLNLTVYDGANSAYVKLDESATSFSDVLTTYFGAATSNCTSATFHNVCYHDHNQSVGTTLTYTLNFKAHSSDSSGVRVNDHMSSGDEVSSITLMEIAQ